MNSKNNVQVTVFPGDPLLDSIEEKLREKSKLGREFFKGLDDGISIKIGSGIFQKEGNSTEDLFANVTGILKLHSPNFFYIETRKKRYVPAVNDLVIGIVTTKTSELYKVDIGINSLASLTMSGFEGITKKNRPNLMIGNVIFARIVLANKDFDPELVCYDQNMKGEGFGEIKTGLVIKCHSSYSRSLQKPECPILKLLGQSFAFEIIASANGYFIINGMTHNDTILIANTILLAEKMNIQQIEAFIREITDKRWMIS